MDGMYVIPKLHQPEQGGVIGGAWMSRRLQALLAARLHPQDFVGPDRKLAEALIGEGTAVTFDYLTAESKLDDAARERLTAIQAALLDTPGLRDYNRWMQTIEDESILRQMDAALAQVKGEIKPGANPRQLMSDTVLRLVKINARTTSEIKQIDEAVDRALEMVKAWEEGEKFVNAVPTGFGWLDRLLGGLTRGHICTLGARPSRGKTQFALQIARNAALRIQAEKRDAVVVVFSAEMTEEELAIRLAQTASGVSSEWLRENKKPDGSKPSDIERKRFRDALTAQKGLPMVIDPNSSPTTSHMYRQVAAQMALHKDGVDLVVFDYIELAGNTGGKNANETNRLGVIMRGLKQMAKDHNCALLILSQLNRNVDNRPSRMPELDDLRQSGDIEALSQQVLFIDWPDSYKTLDGYPSKEVRERAEKYQRTYGANMAIMIAKNRNGRARRIVPLNFTPDITRFEEVGESEAEALPRAAGQD